MTVIAAAGPSARIQQEAQANNLREGPTATEGEGIEAPPITEESASSPAAAAKAAAKPTPPSAADPDLGQKVDVYI